MSEKELIDEDPSILELEEEPSGPCMLVIQGFAILLFVFGLIGAFYYAVTTGFFCLLDYFENFFKVKQTMNMVMDFSIYRMENLWIILHYLVNFLQKADTRLRLKQTKELRLALIEIIIVVKGFLGAKIPLSFVFLSRSRKAENCS